MRILAALPALILLLTAGCAEPPAPCITVSNKSIICGSDTLAEDIQVPLLDGFLDNAFEKVLNARIQSFVDNARSDAREQAQTVQQWMPFVCVLTVDFEVKNSCGIFSMRLTSDLDNGGTGMPRTLYINADTVKSRMLMIDDLFVSADYRENVNRYLTEELMADGHYFEGAFTGINENTDFFVSEARFFITFDKYEVMSGMAGEPVVEIPLELIREHIKPEYAALFAKAA